MTTLLRAVGLSSDEDILSLFDNDVYLKNTIEKILLIILMRLLLKYMRN